VAQGEVERRLAAILAADVVGYSRLMEADEAGTLSAMKAHRRELWTPLTEKHGGRIVGTAGDSLLVEFASAVAAVNCAVAVQRGMAERNAGLPDNKRMELRIGVNIGEVIVDGDDIFGEGVNIAARLETLCEPGGVALSGNVHEQVHGKLDESLEDGGEHEVKNIARPIRVWRWSEDGGAGPAATAGESLALPDKPSIAVLPFDNMSRDPEQEYFSDGIAEDIITALSRIRWFFVIARNTTFTFKGKAVDVQAVAKDLGVNYVLEGSVRKAGERVRVTVQLIDGATGNHLWAERYDRGLEDIFALQDEITENVVGAIEPEIAQAELDRGKAKKPENMDAWDIYLRGRSQVQSNARDSIADGIRQLLAAIEMEPDFARAHAMLATAYGRQLIQGFAEDREQTRELAMQAGSRAVALDKNDADSHVGLGMALRAVKDFEEAILALETAIECNPSHAYAHSTLGMTLGVSGRAEDAMEHHRSALRLSPAIPTWPPSWDAMPTRATSRGDTRRQWNWVSGRSGYRGVGCGWFSRKRRRRWPISGASRRRAAWSIA
jgi:adenylate cyclase